MFALIPQNTRQKNLLQLWGPDDSFYFNPMLLQNIVQSNYFQKCCRDITDWNMLVDEIYYQVKHLQPWAAGAFAILCLVWNYQIVMQVSLKFVCFGHRFEQRTIDCLLFATSIAHSSVY